MEAAAFSALCSSRPPSTPSTDTITRRLIRKGVTPTPKILHTMRKKEAQKSLRRLKKLGEAPPSQSESQSLALEVESRFQTVAREYRELNRMLGRRKNGGLEETELVGEPWKRGGGLREFGGRKDDLSGLLRRESLKELEDLLAQRNGEAVRWLWDKGERNGAVSERRPMPENDAIRFIIEKLIAADLNVRDWKFSRLMSYPGLQFTERNLLQIVEGLGASGHWRHALSVVEWVYKLKNYRDHQSRFVYTKLLAVLGDARRPKEALRIFHMMREDNHIYPDLPAYRNIASTLGQAGLLRELLNVMEVMRQKPRKRIKNMSKNHWDRCLEPDVVVLNSVLNACVSSKQWKGVFWVFEQMKKNGIKPTDATYGLAMEVMLKSGKHELVHNFFDKLKKGGFPPNALTYKVLVRTFWEESKVDDAVEAVRDMERRGITGTGSVYYELACCLCFNGRWKEAILQVKKLKNLPRAKPLEVAFTGMIQSCLNGKHLDHAISVFEGMKGLCTPNIGTINAMLKAYGRNDMFARAKTLFEESKCIVGSDGTFLSPDAFSYNSMLEASASAHQWDYFEHVYKEMIASNYEFDHKKRAWPLVEASKAGKWHVLEHAFDMILEAGEIPHISIFFEMVCQNTARHNYDRVVAIVNCMSHASLQVSENQWNALFSKNEGRIGREDLSELLCITRNGEILTEEITAVNFVKTLENLCGNNVCRNITDGQFIEKVDMSRYETGEVLGEKTVHEPGIYPDYNYDRTDDGEDDSKFSENRLTGALVNEMSDFRIKSSALSDDAVVETNWDLPTVENDDSSASMLPSAYEILETWRKRRIKDDVLILPASPSTSAVVQF